MPAEVRVTSATGGQKGTKIARYDLIPSFPLEKLAILYGTGARKYAPNNWRNGYDWSNSIASVMRHFEAWRQGKDYDVCSNEPDNCKHVDSDGNPFEPIFEDTCFNHTGAHHLDAAAWNVFALREFAEFHPDYDDRFIYPQAER